MVGLPLSRVSFLHKHEEVSSLNDGTTNECCTSAVSLVVQWFTVKNVFCLDS